MKIYLYAIKDRQMNAFMAPIALPTTGVAIRMLRDQVNDTNNALFKHPSDYSLWQLGHYDDATGEITNEQEKIAEADNYTENQFV